MISIGSKKMVDCQVGSKKVKEIYVGDKKVWPTSLWSGTLTSHTPYGEICTIPDISSSTEITITLEYVSGTWGTGSQAYEQRLYFLPNSTDGLREINPPLSASNPKFTYTFNKSYNSATTPFWCRKADSWQGSDTCSIDINFTTGVVSAGKKSSTNYATESSPVKITINATNP